MSWTKPRNNFDFVRVAAAMMVLVSHQFALLGVPQPLGLPGISYGECGVCLFFSLSGFLVAQSWIEDPHALRFMARRCLRVWPGLYVVTCLTVLVLGPLISTMPKRVYFGSAETLSFFGILWLHIRYSLPGVFAHNPYRYAVNGSLWTIPLEVKCYAGVLVAGCLRLFTWRWIVLGALLAYAAHYFIRADAIPRPDYLSRYGLFFAYGVCLQLFRNCWEGRRWPIFFALLLGSISSTMLLPGNPFAALWLVLPYAAIAFGLASTPIIRRAGRFGDLSYGIYIYAFPIQQLLIAVTSARWPLPVYLSLSITSTVFCAFVSWHGVEKPMLRFKPRSRMSMADATREA